MRSKITIIITCTLLCSISSFAAIENSTELYKKGKNLAIKGKQDEAIKVFKRVIKINPYYCLGHYGLGKAYLYKKGFLNKALRHLKKSVELDRRLSKGHFYLGMAYFLSKKYKKAIKSLKNSYKYDDNLIEALYNIAMIYDVTGNKYNARLYYKMYRQEKIKGEEDLPF